MSPIVAAAKIFHWFAVSDFWLSSCSSMARLPVRSRIGCQA
jgi:hypothetical protein